FKVNKRFLKIISYSLLLLIVLFKIRKVLKAPFRPLRHYRLLYYKLTLNLDLLG
ncbi:hypothetical protein FPSE_11243, partial [Fusarium pseudograminearum CS3096]